jgi:hypothetical protein
MPFELYKRTRATSEAETVSISAVGIITVSPVFAERYFKDADYAELYYDAASKRVAIKPLKNETDYSYQIIRPKNSHRASVSGRGFLRSYKIGLADKGKFKPETFDAKFEDGMIVFSVRKDHGKEA